MLGVGGCCFCVFCWWGGGLYWGLDSVQNNTEAWRKNNRQTSDISHTLVDNKIVDHSDVVGASPVGAAPLHLHSPLNTLRPRQNGRHFPDDIFKCIFLNQNV